MLRSSTKVNDEVWDFGEIELKPYDFSTDAAPVDDTPFDWGMSIPQRKEKPVPVRMPVFDEPVVVYEEEDIIAGVEPISLEAMEMDMICQNVELRSWEDVDVTMKIDELNNRILRNRTPSPVYSYSVAEVDGAVHHYAVVLFEDWGYSVGPSLTKKQLNKDFIRMYYSSYGKFSYLMSKFLTEAVERVALKRMERLTWQAMVNKVILTVTRGGRDIVYQSEVGGTRGVSSCNRQYLKEQMGFELIVGDSFVEGYKPLKNLAAWRTIIGEYTFHQRYLCLKRQQKMNDDYRTPIGCQIVDGVDLRLCVDTRPDYRDIVSQCFVSRGQVVQWMERRYGHRYACDIAKVILNLTVREREYDPIKKDDGDAGRSELQGHKLIAQIEKVLHESKQGLSLDGIVREVRRHFRIDVKEVAIVMRIYLHRRWEIGGHYKRWVYRVPLVWKSKREQRVEGQNYGDDYGVRSDDDDFDVVKEKIVTTPDDDIQGDPGPVAIPVRDPDLDIPPQIVDPDDGSDGDDGWMEFRRQAALDQEADERRARQRNVPRLIYSATK
jgi:hypothetical protein